MGDLFDMDRWAKSWEAFFGQDENNQPEPAPAAAPVSEDVTNTGAVMPDSAEQQATQRRLARLSKYWTSPTGVLDEANLGSTGVFS